ncbi:dihydroorotase [Heyndrickxia shackletonii]|uniref:Dihydroorotase n=1 Tax=Heyndrickxia shackletonii TaxID=157838 RepID=A0A0Q3TL35_9BACI|nr:dihydroorotase [Heyndrickxia shackletonii]KQL54696.1 dihydroorotase [Heyndrickxia shackletonii]NEY98347.1 dihydroorotase [Heyndrickxia shackletonii]
MNYLLKNGMILTENGEMQKSDIRIKSGKIYEVGTHLENHGEKEISADSYLVTPGFLDLHIHLREPGGEHKETIDTGTLAAAKGGFTTVAPMPNTKPVPDTPEQMEWLHKRIKETAHVRVLPYASITMNQAGDELTDFAGLKRAGAFAFTDDGVGVQTASVMHEAMKRAAAQDMAIVAHCEDNSLIYGGAYHEGEFTKKHGISGIPSICESVQIARDVLLAESTNCHYHVCHISTKESVRVVREAKKAGIKVTAEVTPHHLLLCDEDIPSLDTNYKMNPPLRGKADQKALIEGLLDGTIDFIATDHAPHAAEEKAKGYASAPFGIVGLETAFPLLYTNFVEKGIFTLKQLVDWLTIKPAESFKLPYGTLKIGASADIILLDLQNEKTIDPAQFLSKGKNTPFTNWNCKGWPVATFVDGELKWSDGGAFE